MKKGRTSTDYLEDIKEAIKEAIDRGLKFIEEMDFADFREDEKTQRIQIVPA